MNCDELRESIALYAGGDLPGAAELDEHLLGCERCRNFAAEVGRSIALMRVQHLEELPPAACSAVCARVFARLAGERRMVWWRRAAVGLAASLALVAGLATLNTWRVPPPAAPLPFGRGSAPVAAVTAGVPEKPPSGSGLPPRRVKVHRVVHREPAEPLTIKLLTDDPDVIIYWIVEKKGD